MTPTQLKELEDSLRERAKSYGDYLDDIQHLKKDLANVIAHLRAAEEDAEKGFHDAQDAVNGDHTFEDAWKAWGSDYGPEALRQVRLGWDLRGGTLSAPAASMEKVPLKSISRTVRHEVDISEDNVMQTSDDVATARALLVGEYNALLQEKKYGGHIDDDRLTLVSRVLDAFARKCKYCGGAGGLCSNCGGTGVES